MRRLLIVGSLVAACTGSGKAPPLTPHGPKLNYPAARTDQVVDDYHGVKVADPYRWLEELDSDDTHAWVQAENQVTQSYLAGISERIRIRLRLTKLWDFERATPPFKKAGRYFYFHNDGLQNQNVLYTMNSLEDEPRLLLDPNTLSEDGTVSLTGLDISQDGKLMAYGLSAAGSDWEEWHVKDIETGQDRPDLIKWVKFGGASWNKQATGFFYSRYAEPAAGAELTEVNYYQKIYFHVLGGEQKDDVLVYERPDDKELYIWGSVTDDGRYVVIGEYKGTDTRNHLLYLDLQDKGRQVKPLAGEKPAQYSYVGNDGATFWVLTDLDAPRGRLMAIDLKNPDKWQEVIPQADETLAWVSVINHQLIASYMKDAHAEVKVFDTSGKLVREVALPGLGDVTGFGGRAEDTETFYSFQGFTTPATVYRLDMKSGDSSVFFAPKVDFKPAQFETKQVFYTSKDGTKVPMFISYKKGLVLDGTNPTYLYGYGGFSIPITPFFSVSKAVWMEMGGVFAVPNLRGGNEYGEEWHQAGMLDKKQNVFDDFIAAAEYLIAEKYTSPAKLAIAGGSNGGLLVGACMTQRPELFGAALPDVGVMDMLRFHKFTVGWGWVPEYGSSDDPAQFKTLYAYSPLHNIKPGVSYPATLAMTADHDDRVVPAHTFKFIAALQAAQGGAAPILVRIETDAGHGGKTPTSKRIEEATDQTAFLVKVLEMAK